MFKRHNLKIYLFHFISFFQKKNNISKFSLIYRLNFWINGSGSGSTLNNTLSYNDFLINFISKYKISNIVDIGCGDWQSSYKIYEHYENINYVGFDCVKKIIDRNTLKYPKYKFSFIDVIDNFELIPNCDLFIIKDVLQHWDTESIYTFLDNLISNKCFKYILITNNANQSKDNLNLNSFFGNGRGLNANYLPLKKYNPKIVLEYFADEFKQISLITYD
jgi:hypothetical protein